jgi:hypothetical protein
VHEGLVHAAALILGLALGALVGAGARLFSRPQLPPAPHVVRRVRAHEPVRYRRAR